VPDRDRDWEGEGEPPHRGTWRSDGE
jgi:hypothetical protein